MARARRQQHIGPALGGRMITLRKKTAAEARLSLSNHPKFGAKRASQNARAPAPRIRCNRAFAWSV